MDSGTGTNTGSGSGPGARAGTASSGTSPVAAPAGTAAATGSAAAFAAAQAAQPSAAGAARPPSSDLNSPAIRADPGSVALAAAQGTQASAVPSASPLAAVVGQPQPAAQPAAQAPLAGQLTGPLFSLAAGKPGEHTMTINVTPDNLGPVTVRAHITAGDVRLELFAPNDAGREALRSILPDLKRDLAATGPTSLDLSSGNQPGPQSGQSGPQLGDSGGQGAGNTPLPSSRRNADVPGRPAPGPAPGVQRPRSSDSTLDVLA